MSGNKSGVVAELADSCRVRAGAFEEVSRGQMVGGRLWGQKKKKEAFLDSCCNNVNKCLPLSN